MALKKPKPAPFHERNTSPKAQKRIAKVAKLVDADTRAMGLLFNANFDFDHYIGWIYDDAPPTDDAIASIVDSGLCPPSFSITAKAAFKRLIAARDAISVHNVVAAFANSLVTGRPDFRSILGTYACFCGVSEKNLIEAHKTPPNVNGIHMGQKKEVYHPYRVVFTRFFRANCMEHDDLVGAILEFEAFLQFGDFEITAKARQCITKLIEAIQRLPSEAKLSDLNAVLQGTFPGNKQDRQHVLETLGYCEVLRPAGQPRFLGRYTNLESSPLPAHFYTREWRYPTCWWSGSDGVNEDAVEKWFGLL